jgi:hypothetical protein
MLQKLSNLCNSIKSFALKVWAMAPYLCCVSIGYIFKPEIKFLIDAAADIIKGISKL